MLIAGAISYFQLPLSEYPQVTPPTVQVTASYPGANPQVIADTVASPLEQAINGVEGMMYMQSTSTSNGVVEIQVTFEIGADPDQAAVNVNNRVKQADARLPLGETASSIYCERGGHGRGRIRRRRPVAA